MIFHWTWSLFVGLATFDTSLTTAFSQFGEWLELLWSYQRVNSQVSVAFSNVFLHQGSFANLHRAFARACRGQEDNQPPRTRARDWSRPDEREAGSSEASCHPSLRFGVSDIKEIRWKTCANLENFDILQLGESNYPPNLPEQISFNSLENQIWHLRIHRQAGPPLDFKC